MRVGFIIINNEDKSLIQTFNKVAKFAFSNDIYMLTTSPDDWETIGNICKPCCGNKDSYRTEDTDTYSLKAVKNIAGVKFGNKSDIYQYISTSIKNEYDFLMIIKCGYEISMENFEKIMQCFDDIKIGMVYSDSDFIVQSITPFIRPNENHIAGCAVRSSLIQNSASNILDILESVYQKSIIKKIPEKIYESIYKKD